MKVGLAAIIAAFVVLRVWFHFRRRGVNARSAGRSGLGPFSGDVALVAAREIRERLRGRIFKVGTLLILVAVAAAIVIPVLNKNKPQSQQVGVVGTLPAVSRTAVVASGKSLGTAIHFRHEPDMAAARSALRSGSLDLAIVNGRELLVNKAIGPNDTSTTAQLVLTVAQNLGVVEAMEAAKLSPIQASVLAHARSLRVVSLRPGKPKGASQTTSVVGLILVFIMLTQYNTWILIGVMEEKASRVVEVLLAAVKPVKLLAGKVLGIGLVAFAQASLIVAFALVLASSVGSDLLKGTAPLVLASTLLWLVLGYTFYCWVYAAAGSMASRQDQVQSLAFPLSLPIIFGYVTALTAASTSNASILIKVLAYLPPTAPFAMPVLVGLGAVTWWEFAASAALSLVCTVGVARLAAGVYRRAILRTGRRVQVREIVSRRTG